MEGWGRVRDAEEVGGKVNQKSREVYRVRYIWETDLLLFYWASGMTGRWKEMEKFKKSLHMAIDVTWGFICMEQ